jgi:hypothetical protein
MASAIFESRFLVFPSRLLILLLPALFRKRLKLNCIQHFLRCLLLRA